ncbi:MAG TPA: GNAT family N-acetyltransferase [Candidatus Dormibacteraeota bacterium]|nr:GNAT family N-acetyltransferase [Candidatus Dormibacteraeota bacterium]
MLIETLAESELGAIRPLLVDLLHGEQELSAKPQLSPEQLERWLPITKGSFLGENHIFAAKEEGRILGFCWCLLFDPGTGLEGEVAELYVTPEARGQGVASRLVEEAVALFAKHQVTFACVWTRESNRAAVSAYRRAGFGLTDQLVLTWYPSR